MKKQHIFLFALFFCISLTAQEFAPIGAEWNYKITHFASPEISSNTYISAKDTVINNMNYRVITRERETCNVSYFGDQFIRQSGDSIFWLDASNNEFLLFDYNAEVGDSWLMPLYDINEFFYVDSIYVLTVDTIYFTNTLSGVPLKTYDVTLTEEGSLETGGNYKARYFEYLGFEIGFFPSHATGLCDATYTSSISCYTDENVGLLQLQEQPLGCVINEFPVFQFAEIQVYPNPFRDAFIIDGFELSDKDITVYNLHGEIIPISIDRNVISMVNAPEGIYFVNITMENGVINKRVFKE